MTILQSGVIPSTGGYQIERSLRFNSADSAYLNRTPASASNRRTWTWSGWVKRSALASNQVLMSSDVGTVNATWAEFGFDSSDRLYLGFYSGTRYTTPVYRDTSAWYHIVIVFDTTQATENNRVLFYVNGVLQDRTGDAGFPSQNTDYGINNNQIHAIGQRNWSGGVGRYLNGYMTEVNFIDGQALTPSDFGETDSNTGVWKPKAFSGTYGTNGFYLKFADNSGTTSTTLGKDSSGNGNNWTPNNFSVTAGAGNDSLVDSPTAYGTDSGLGAEVRGNYATLNPINSSSSYTLSNGNLKLVCPSGTFPDDFTHATIQIPTTGKWYWTCTYTEAGGGGGVGVTPGSVQVSYGTLTGTYATFRADGTYAKAAGVTANSTPASASNGDVYTFAFDADNGRLYIAKNATPNTSSTAQLTGFTTGIPYNVSFNNTTNTSQQTREFCFGASAFPYAAPTGYKALCTQNLPTPTIGATSTTQAGKYFNPVLYSGNSSTQSITGVGFQPDLVWIKIRNSSGSHGLYDAVRGTTKRLYSDLTAAEGTVSGVTAFSSDGFTLGSDSSANGTSFTYVAWNWKANGAGSSNTAGTITSTVSANTTSGFSIVTYTGNFTASQTVGHGLSTAPVFIIAKRRDATSDWGCIHPSLAATQIIRFNLTGAAETNDWFANTRPTSSVFYVGQNSNTNPSGGTMVAYCFAPVAGYSAFGSYTGNGSTDGPFVFTNFRPRFILVKQTNTTRDWKVYDTARNTYNIANLILTPNLSDAEETGVNNFFDILSNGFKIRSSGATLNDSGGTFIYMALAENPFKYSLGR